MGLVALFAVIAGFFTTYIRPSFNGTLSIPPVVHIHGFFALGWVVLFSAQTVFIRVKNIRLHMSLGYLGLFIAAGITVTMLPTGLFQVNRDLKNGLGDTAISSILGIITTLLAFLIFVTAGFLYRKKPKMHKRLFLFATIILIWPAWFRFRHYFPSVPRPDIWFGVVMADSLIIFLWIADKITYGKIHPVSLWCGALIISEHIIEILTFDSGPWRMISKSIYHALNGIM